MMINLKSSKYKKIKLKKESRKLKETKEGEND